MILEKLLQKNLQAVDLEDAADAGLAHLMRVQQLHLACALIEIVAQGDAVAPALDLPALRPELQVNRVACLEHPAKYADVDNLCHDVTNTLLINQETMYVDAL